MRLINIYIIRNALLASNASLHRVIEATHKEHNVTVVSRDRGESTKYIEELVDFNDEVIKNLVIKEGSVRGSGFRNIKSLIKYQFKLFKLLIKKRKEIDVIHSFDLDTGLISLFFSKIFKKKYNYHIADFYVDSRSGLSNKIKTIVKKLEFWVINNAENTIICTDERINQISGSDPKKIHVIHNVPMINPKMIDVAEKNKKNTKRIIICYIGTLSSTRFLEEILKYVSLNPLVELTIGGYGPFEKVVIEYSQRYSNITFLGEVTYTDSFKYYSEADIMVAMYNPSQKNHRYSAPNKVYEAILLEKPIIVAENTGIDKLVKKLNIGFVINYNYRDFEVLMDGILHSPEQIENLLPYFEAALDIYNWGNMKQKFNAIYGGRF